MISPDSMKDESLWEFGSSIFHAILLQPDLCVRKNIQTGSDLLARVPVGFDLCLGK